MSGGLIGGGGGDATVSEYVISTYDEVIGNYSIPSSATASSQGTSGTATSVNCLVVAGGGGGAKGYFDNPNGRGGGGGGAGGFYEFSDTLSVTSYSVVVGAGGAGGSSVANGENSSFNNKISYGGLKGNHAPDAGGNGKGGNSGGNNSPASGKTGGNSSLGGGGGAGNSVNGGNASYAGGSGGAGTSSSISGSSVTYASGGGGGGSYWSPTSYSGGSSQTGGNGGSGNNAGSSATANSGGGGGGAGGRNTTGGSGGSGVVIISYTTGSCTATGGTITTSGGNTIHTFTSSGTFEITEIIQDVAYAIDNDTSTTWGSLSETNPNIYIDTGSSQKLSGLAIHYNSDTTETEIKIQTSDNASTWTDKRTILTSALTNNAWNYIRFPIITARYIRIYGNSGSSTILSINELKHLVSPTDTLLVSSHSHLAIDPEDSTLNLDGTSA